MTVAAKRPPKAIRISPAQLRRYFEAKLAAELGPHNVKRLMDLGGSDFVILDVRSADGYRDGHVPGAVNIPFEELPARMPELQKSKEIISYCWDVTCLLCTKASYILAQKGYKAREMIGGVASWKAAGFPLEK